MGLRYRVQDVPNVGAGAFMPLPARNPVASSYGLVHVKGAPGTDPVPVPYPGGLPSLTAQGGVNCAQDGRNSPQAILPAIYVPLADNMGPAADAGLGMARRRLNELPIRAVDPGRRPVAVFVKFPAGGKQIPQPRPFVRWPARFGNSGSATGRT